MEKNDLNEIESDAFNGLEELTELNLYDNKLSKLTGNMLKGLKQLYFIDLVKNQLIDIDFNAFTHLNKLIDINLSNNLGFTPALLLHNSLSNAGTFKHIPFTTPLYLFIKSINQFFISLFFLKLGILYFKYFSNLFIFYFTVSPSSNIKFSSFKTYLFPSSKFFNDSL
jgi:hypothetical protein